MYHFRKELFSLCILCSNGEKMALYTTVKFEKKNLFVDGAIDQRDRKSCIQVKSRLSSLCQVMLSFVCEPPNNPLRQLMNGVSLVFPPFIPTSPRSSLLTCVFVISSWLSYKCWIFAWPHFHSYPVNHYALIL